jgi:hypothetical protein
MVRCAMGVGVGLVLAVAGGCTSGQTGKVQRNLTPELRTMSDRPVDTRNSFWVAWNENKRLGWEDFYRGALWDRSSRLTPHPTGR